MGYVDEINVLIAEHKDTSQIYKVNEHIFTQGDSFKGVFYILEGRVKIFKDSHNQPLMLWSGEANEFIGITSYFDNSGHYQFTATASGNKCKLIYISANNFNELLNKIPGIMEEIIKKICQRISLVELRINNHIQHSIRQRFIDTINFIYKRFVSQEQNQHTKRTALRYSINDLSEMIGTSKKTLIKLIKEYENNNLLRVQGNNIIINNISKFRKILEV